MAVMGTEIDIFSFETRRSKNPPQLVKQFLLHIDMKNIKQPIEIKHIDFAKDLLLTVYFETFVNFYSIDGAGSRQMAKIDYKIDSSAGLTYYQSSKMVDGVLNIFFTGPQKTIPEGEEKSPMFGLYCLPIESTSLNY